MNRVVFLLLLSAWVLPGGAQDKPDTVKVLVETLPGEARKQRDVEYYENAPLNDILFNFAKDLNRSFFCDPRITERVTARIVVADPWSAMQDLADAYGYRLMETKTGLRAFKKSWEGEDDMDKVVYQAKNLPPDMLKKALETVITKSGKVEANVGSGSVIISDIRSHIPTIMRALGDLDRPDRMINIETLLIEATVNPVNSMGLDWSKTWGGGGQKVSFGDANSLQSIINMASSANNPTFLAPTAAQLNVAAFQVFIKYMNDVLQSKVHAQPNVIIPNHGSKAVLKGVRQEPIPQFGQTATLGGVSEIGITGITYKDIGTILELTEVHILEGDVIRMKVQPSVSSSNSNKTFTGSSGNLNAVVPVIDMREYTSEVLLKDGNVLVLGGLFDGSVTLTEHRVPVLGDIPLLGYAFRSRDADKKKRNLIISLRATILDPRNPNDVVRLNSHESEKMAVKKEDYSVGPKGKDRSVGVPEGVIFEGPEGRPTVESVTFEQLKVEPKAEPKGEPDRSR